MPQGKSPTACIETVKSSMGAYEWLCTVAVVAISASEFYGGGDRLNSSCCCNVTCWGTSFTCLFT